jgi:hypothetical protein
MIGFRSYVLRIVSTILTFCCLFFASLWFSLPASLSILLFHTSHWIFFPPHSFPYCLPLSLFYPSFSSLLCSALLSCTSRDSSSIGNAGRCIQRELADAIFGYVRCITVQYGTEQCSADQRSMIECLTVLLTGPYTLARSLTHTHTNTHLITSSSSPPTP